jgi:hypothetical protein
MFDLTSLLMGILSLSELFSLSVPMGMLKVELWTES